MNSNNNNNRNLIMFKTTMIGVIFTLLISLFISNANAQTEMWLTMPEGLAAINGDEDVAVSAIQVAPLADSVWETSPSFYYQFSPVNQTAVQALIIFPGAYVPAEAYAPIARNIASAGYMVFVLPVPNGIAIGNADRAYQVINNNPHISNWNVGGHSLGGVVASGFANGNPLVDGIVLWASYPASDISLSPQRFISIYGSNDGISTPDEIAASAVNLPASTKWSNIVGANHSQFAWYYDEAHANGSVTGNFVQPTPEPGDNPAHISREEQQVAIVQATVDFLKQVPIITLEPTRISDNIQLSKNPTKPTLIASSEDYIYWEFSDKKTEQCNGPNTHIWQFRGDENEAWTTESAGTYLRWVWTLDMGELMGSGRFEFRAAITDCEGNETVTEIYYIQVDLPPVFTGNPGEPARVGDLVPLSTNASAPTLVESTGQSIVWSFDDDKESCSGSFIHTWQYRRDNTQEWSFYTPETHLYWVWTEDMGMLSGEGDFEFQVSVTDCSGQSAMSSIYYITLSL